MTGISNRKQQRMTMESLETRTMMAADALEFHGMADEGAETAARFISCNSGDVDSFVADSFSFGVEREMKESGEKGGTEDINIGVGELQECTISKSMDWATSQLAQFAINGNGRGRAEIEFVEVGGGDRPGAPACYLRYKLDRAFIKSWSTSGDADDRPTEEVAFYYNKIAFNYARTVDGLMACETPGTVGLLLPAVQ